MKVIDLTLPISGDLANVEISPDDSFAEYGVTMSWLKLHSHSGTHMDAPLHFIPGGSSMENVPLEKCAGPALVVDMSHKSWNSFITVDDLRPYAAKITSGSRVLIRTDWDKEYGQPHYGGQFPRIHVEAAEWLAERGIWLIGVEHPSVAALADIQELTVVHHAFLKRGVVIVEGLANLRALPEEFIFVSLPLKVIGGDGTPSRAAGLVLNESRPN